MPAARVEDVSSDDADSDGDARFGGEAETDGFEMTAAERAENDAKAAAALIASGISAEEFFESLTTKTTTTEVGGASPPQLSVSSDATTMVMPGPLREKVTAGAPKFAGITVYCGECGGMECITKVRCLSKTGEGRYRCNVCSTKVTQLYRELGQWPTLSTRS